MSDDITVHSYPHNGIKGQRPRRPMVHLLGSDDYGNVQSISFHPDDAPAVAKAILGAGRSAAAGHGRKPVKIALKPQD